MIFCLYFLIVCNVLLKIVWDKKLNKRDAKMVIFWRNMIIYDVRINFALINQLCEDTYMNRFHKKFPTVALCVLYSNVFMHRTWQLC